MAELPRALPTVLSALLVVLLIRAMGDDVSPPCASGSSEERTSQLFIGVGLFFAVAATLLGIAYIRRRARLGVWFLAFAVSLVSPFVGVLATFGCLQ